MVLLLGGTDIVHFGPRENPKRDKYWAERGLIHYENTETNEYQTLSVRQFLHRLKGVNDMLGNSITALKETGFAHGDEIRRQQKFVEEAIALVYKAKEQGMPSDPAARRAARRAAPKSVVMPNCKHIF